MSGFLQNIPQSKMKLFRELDADLNLVAAYDASAITIKGQAYSDNLILTPDAVFSPWASQRSFSQLEEGDFAQIRDLQPALVLLGTGIKQRFPKPALLRALIDARIGYEVMDTGSACRTYNILATEGRLVVAALMLEPAA